MTIARESATATVTVTRDATAAKAPIDTLVTAYNDLVAFLGDQRTAAADGQVSIARDPLVQQLRVSLRSVFLGAHPNSGSFTRLAEVGIGFDRSGQMVLDPKLFEAALAGKPADLQALFSGSNGQGGAFGTAAAMVKAYTQSGGLVADVRERLTTQARALADRIDLFEQQLERRRLTLQQEFQAADEAMSQLNAQMASLAALNSQYRLF
jgi:flagellar hook-associated protein 2